MCLNMNFKCERFVILLITLVTQCSAKYMEGHLRTSDNWAFLARFCFLSEQGMFEYYFEFNSYQGTPNLLLYYDADNQWPAVYKTSKDCHQREMVLKIDQNQIVNLTAKNLFSGCTYHSDEREIDDLDMYATPKTTRAKTYTLNIGGPYKTTPLSNTTIIPNRESSANSSEVYNLNTTSDFDIDIFGIDSFNSSFKDQTEDKSVKKRSVPAKQEGPRDALITCRNARKFRSSRERWWFIAVSNCDGLKGIDVKYKILMTNGPPGDYWHEQFSADEFYVLPVLMAFSIAYAMLIVAIIMCSVELKSRQLLHSTYKLFVLSVILQLFGIAMQSLAYLKYAVTGVVGAKARVLGGLFMGASETCYILVLLLLAKGYTTTRGRLPLSASVKITVFMCVYSVTYVTLFVYEAKVFDPGEVLYLYESPAGYGLIVLRVVAWWMFIYSTIFTLKHYPEKSNFYYPFNICGTLWFVAGPAFILSANSYIDKWVRESVVYGVLLFITFAGHLMFLVLTMPSMANKNFPYHIRTTQIGVMEVAGAAGASTIDQFGHHAYEPSTTVEQTVIIPLHPSTEDVFTIQGLHSSSQRKDAEQRPAESDDEDSQAEVRSAHVNMDNVLRWSAAKASAPPSTLLRDHRGSTQCNSENELADTSMTPSKPFHAQSPMAPVTENGLVEWVREVPVELFTISKLVVNRPTT